MLPVLFVKVAHDIEVASFASVSFVTRVQTFIDMYEDLQDSATTPTSGRATSNGSP